MRRSLPFLAFAFGHHLPGLALVASLGLSFGASPVAAQPAREAQASVSSPLALSLEAAALAEIEARGWDASHMTSGAWVQSRIWAREAEVALRARLGQVGAGVSDDRARALALIEAAGSPALAGGQGRSARLVLAELALDAWPGLDDRGAPFEPASLDPLSEREIERAWEQGEPTLALDENGELAIRLRQHESLARAWAARRHERLQDFLFSELRTRDERTVAHYEALLRHEARRREGMLAPVAFLAPLDASGLVPERQFAPSAPWDVPWVHPLAELAAFYSNARRYDQAVSAWQRARHFSMHPEWLAASGSEAAHTLLMARRDREAYDQYVAIAPHARGWLAAMALFHRATHLARTGDAEAAVNLLLSPPREIDDQIRGITGDAVWDLTRHAWIAPIQYRRGDLLAAKEHADLALSLSEAVSSTSPVMTRFLRTAKEIRSLADARTE